MINLFYLSKNTTGGWVTFTSHLARSLMAAGVSFNLFKIGNTTEYFPRPFGYGLQYRNITLKDALEIEGQNLIVACAKQLADEAKALLAAGSKIVIHDPTEVKSYLNPADVKQPWVIRKVNAAMVGGVFIRHPYVRQDPVPDEARPDKRKGCVSISRIDFDKHTDILLDANRLGAGIRIHGFENRLYTRFKIMPNYPEWEQSKAAYPRENNAAFYILLGANSMADMSIIKGDGGGTQYTTLEAWDAGTVPIVQKDWLLSKDDLVHGKNVWSVTGPEELKKMVKVLDKDTGLRSLLVTHGYTQLKKHNHKVIVPQVLDWLGA